VDGRSIPLNKTLPRDLCPEESREDSADDEDDLVESHNRLPFESYVFFCGRARYVLLSRLRQTRTGEQRITIESAR